MALHCLPLILIVCAAGSIHTDETQEANEQQQQFVDYRPALEGSLASQLGPDQWAKVKFYGCHALNFEDQLCESCCQQSGQVPQPDPLASLCECVTLDEAPFLAADKKIKKQFASKTAELACESLKFNQDECKSCCNKNWLQPYKGAWWGNRCKCGQVSKEWNSDVGQHFYALKTSGIFGAEKLQPLGFVSEFNYGRLGEKEEDDHHDPDDSKSRGGAEQSLDY